MADTLSQSVRLFVPESFEGTMASVYMKYLMRDNLDMLEVNFVSGKTRFQFSDLEKYDGAHVYLLGIPYKGEELPGSFYDLVDNPFEDFVHACTFGQKIENLDNQKSIVTENIDPCAVLDRMISKGHSVLSNFLTPDEFSSVLVRAVQDYRTWDWKKQGNSMTHRFQVYYKLFGKSLLDEDRSYDVHVLDETYYSAFKAQERLQTQQIQTAFEQAKYYHIDGDDEISLYVLYCTEEKNMVADYILQQSETRNTSSDGHVAVLLSPTRGSSDMATIRTRDADARVVASAIADKPMKVGTSEASFAFLGGSVQEIMGNSIVGLLQDNKTISDIISTKGER